MLLVVLAITGCSESSESTIVGRWVSTESEIVFFDDGTFSEIFTHRNRTSTGTYAITDEHLRMTVGGSTDTFTYSFQNDTLTMVPMLGGRSVTLVRFTVSPGLVGTWRMSAGGYSYGGDEFRYDYDVEDDDMPTELSITADGTFILTQYMPIAPRPGETSVEYMKDEWSGSLIIVGNVIQLIARYQSGVVVIEYTLDLSRNQLTLREASDTGHYDFMVFTKLQG
jgi:hypothetical protein